MTQYEGHSLADRSNRHQDSKKSLTRNNDRLLVHNHDNGKARILSEIYHNNHQQRLLIKY